MASLGNPTLKANDAVDGAMGRCIAEIDGKIEDMFYVESIITEVEFDVKGFRVLGYTGEKYRTVGWKGTGSATIRSVTSIFCEKAINYIKQGKLSEFSIIIENNDPASGAGTQRMLFEKVTITKMVLANLDVKAEILSEDIEFKYENPSMLEKYSAIQGEIMN